MLNSKVAIVTGGARGIGEAIVRKFTDHGAKVIIADVLEQGYELAESLEKEGKEVHFLKTDVTNSKEISRLVDTTIRKYGKINILCNNAAINIPGSVEELEESDWDRTINVNLKSQFLMSKYVIPKMRNGGEGSIINMASANSFVAEARLAAYVASKGAILMLTKSMAIDLAKDNIRVNCICPGWVDTSFNDAHAELFGGRDKVLKELPNIQVIGRPIEPNEIANLALFLASNLSSSMTGSALMGDGGITAGR